jgi:L-ascorbate metabolism protein UlaG (beta-lactamase superfamily)
MMIPAFKKDEELVQEMDDLLPDDQHVCVWWLGQSGFLIQHAGVRILADPYLSDSLTKKYENTPMPHIRMSERVIKPELLQGIQIISSSHNHTDHLDAETLLPILKNNPQAAFIIPEANRAFVCERLGCPLDFPFGLNDGESIQVAGITIHGMAAKHNEIERDVQGRCLYMGYVFSNDGFSIYHSGDTLLFDEMIPLLSPLTIDIALLPINGNKPERKVAGNLDAREAVLLGKAIGAKRIVPCHYDMFTFNTADVSIFAELARANHQPFEVLPPGGHFKYPIKFPLISP